MSLLKVCFCADDPFAFLSFARFICFDSVKKLRSDLGDSPESLSDFLNGKGTFGNGVLTVIVDPSSVKDPQRKCGARFREKYLSTALAVS